MKIVDIAFCADRNVLPGLHVTIYTLLGNLSGNAKVRIHILHDGLMKRDLDLLVETAKYTGGEFEFFHYNVDIRRFSKFKWLTGWMTYGRLLLGDVVEVSRILYLDCDLLVNIDIVDLFEIDLGRHVLGAVSRQTIAQSNDRAFFELLGINTSGDYFNGGVLLIDLDKWRSDDVLSKCLNFAEQAPEISSADQTILNYVFLNNYKKLPGYFNLPIHGDRKPIDPGEIKGKIGHFIGYPKPWSLLGGFLHGQYHLFENVLCQTAMADYRARKQANLRDYWVAIRKMRSYAKFVKARLSW